MPTPNLASKLRLDPAQMSDAVQIQNRLIFSGYLTGPADGKWGPASKRALLEFRFRNGIKSVEPWDEQSEGLLFGNERQLSQPIPVPFAGSWTNEPGVCGEAGEAPPLRLSAQSATTATGDTCTFGPLHTEGTSSWRMTARCNVSGRLRLSNVRLTLNGAVLNWTSENGQASYYRCE
jgi:hypothetical protein